MSLNRTILLVIVIALLLGAVFFTASLWPLGDVTNAQPEAGSTSESSLSTASDDTASDEAQTAAADNNIDATASEPSNTEESGPANEVSPNEQDGAGQSSTGNDTSENAPADNTDVKIYTFDVINSYPHDAQAFTQGLIWHEGLLYEGTGLRGRSSLRKVRLTDGAVEQRIELSDELFGEGITIFGDRIYQLTWQANIGFVYNLSTFEELSTFSYPTEGWGITHDGEQLIMSDGTSTIYFWDPETVAQTDSINVTLRGQPVEMLNELEYINGLIYANVWQTDWIVIIDPATGVVNEMINLAGLLQLPDGYEQRPDVLNGIAYDQETDRLFVTGKLWPQLYEIELVESNQQSQ